MGPDGYLHHPGKRGRKKAVMGRLWAYMGLNLGLFWKIKRYNRPDFFPLRNRTVLRAYFGGRGGTARGGIVETAPITPVEIPSPCQRFL